MKNIVMVLGILLSLGYVCQVQGAEPNTKSIENLPLEQADNATLTQADLIKFKQKTKEINNVIAEFQSRLSDVEATATNNQKSFQNISPDFNNFKENTMSEVSGIKEKNIDRDNVIKKLQEADQYLFNKVLDNINQLSRVKNNLSDFKEYTKNLMTDISDIKKRNIDHDNLIKNLQEADQNSFNQIADNSTQLSVVKRDLSDFKSSNTKKVEQLAATDQLFSENLKASDTKIGDNNQRISQSIDSINSIEYKLDVLKIDTNKDFSAVNDIIKKKTVYWGLSMGGFALIAIFIFVFLKNKLVSNTNSVFEEIGKTKANIDNEYVKLDIKLVELLEKQFTMQKQNEEVKNDTEKEIDHSLPLKVAVEIHRMRKRISNMPRDTKGIKPLTKALERLEEELDQKDYEIVDLMGDKYIEGMTVNPRFIPDESLVPGEKKITKVIMPQINYKEKLIQVADIEVSIGGE
jgi:hypothetical protein